MKAMWKSTVYVETSVVSYLTARPTADLLAAAWQKITADWWETRRNRFDLYQPVVKVGHSGIDTTALLFYTGGHGDGHDT